MTFKSALIFLYGFKNWERSMDYQIELKGFRKFLKAIDSPEGRIKRPILVAGTKGKGSTVAFLSSILSKVGKTGIYTSPHFISILERISIAGKHISEAEFVQILKSIKPYIPKESSIFEILTAIAFIYFIKKKTKFSVFEVGLGGRLDATNALNPEVSVITPISLDHTEVLGNSLTAIAREKCGIIKENGMVVSAPQDEEVMYLIKEICAEKKANLCVIGEDFFCEHPACGLEGSTFIINGQEYNISLLGRHQIINAMTAICAAQKCGIPEEAIKEGVRDARIRGRLEIMWRKPWVVFDGAHNVASSWVLRRNIIGLFNFRKLILIIGLLKDKDKEGIIKALAPITDHAIITSIKSERSINPEELLKLFEQEKISAEIICDSREALKSALKKAKESDLILATGSLYLVGELLGDNKWRL